MRLRNHDRFVPPNHPNWTGRPHRSSMEAFGDNLYASERDTSGRTALAYCIVWAVFLGVLFIL